MLKIAIKKYVNNNKKTVNNSTLFLWPQLNGMDLNDMWFQQDGSNTAHKQIDLLEQRFPDRIIRNSDVNWLTLFSSK